MYNFKNNLKDINKSEKRLILCGIILSLMAISFPFVVAGEDKREINTTKGLK